MTVTRLDAAYMVTCGKTCKLPHGWHMVVQLSRRWLCDGQCPVFNTLDQDRCPHIDEVIATRANERPVRLEVVR